MADACLSTHLNSALEVERLDALIYKDIHHKYPPNRDYKDIKQKYLRKEWDHFFNDRRFSVPNLNTFPQILIESLYDQCISGNFFCHQETDFINLLKETHEQLLIDLCVTPPEFQETHQFSLITLLDHQWFPALTRLYELRTFLQDGVCLSAKPKSSTRFHNLDHESEIQNNWLIYSTEGNWYWQSVSPTGENIRVSKNLFVIETKEGKQFVGTRDHFLLLSDLISQRFLILLACVLADVQGYNNYPSPLIVSHCFYWGDSLIKSFGNFAYDSLSLWESLMIGWILSLESDEACDSSMFWAEMHNSFISSQGDPHKQILEHYILQLKEILNQCSNMDHLTQLFGIYRLWGHPNVNCSAGIMKLKSVACLKRPINFNAVELIHHKWREYFCLSYFKRHQKYPQIKLIDVTSTSYISTKIRDGQEIEPYHQLYNLTDWKNITFQKTFSIPEKYELSEMISDKASSLNKDELIAEIQKTGGCGAAHQRSVIIRWLQSNYNNPREFLHQVDESGFGDQEKVVGLHPKERELKRFARFFGLLTLRKRLYVVLTEALIAECLIPYFPEITMTFDSNTLMTRIHNNTRKLATTVNSATSNFKSYKTVIVNTDFSKWNSNMREEETASMFSDFDHLFGLTNCFRRSHEMFSESQLYLSTGTLPLSVDITNSRLIENESTWSGHYGGIEGLRQKGWTIFTVVILKYVAESMALRCQIMGQGDNQVLIITYQITPQVTVHTLHQEFLKRLNNFLKTIGPPLKREETWSSSNFFIYGKYPVWKGRPLSMSLKKICRAMRLTNEGLQNLESTLSSISANVSAATNSDRNPMIPYLIGIFESIASIQLHSSRPFFSQHSYLPKNKVVKFKVPIQKSAVTMQRVLPNDIFEDIKKHPLFFCRSIFLIPCILGGYPVVKLCDLMIRGFPDPLSLNIWMIKEAIRYCHLHCYVSLVNERVCSCKFQCGSLTTGDKLKLFTDFYASTYDKQTEFLSQSCIVLTNIKRQTTEEQISRGQCSSENFLPISIGKIKVCQKTLCDSLKITPRRLQCLQDKLKLGKKLEDNRGKHSNRPNKIPANVINVAKSHIESFP